jgi:acyl dehydratase
MIATMAYDVCPTIKGESTIFNYGFDKVRFITPVASGGRIRANFTLSDAKSVGPGRTQLIYKVTVEIEGQDRLALVADWIQLIMT